MVADADASVTEPRPDDLETAIAIGDQLVHEAIWHEDRCTLLGETMEPQGEHMVRYRTCDGSLYQGTAGVARFLGHLGRATHDVDQLRTADGALRHAWSQPAGPGLFDGTAGIASASVELGLALNADEYITRGLELAQRTARNTLESRAEGSWDLTSGLCGVFLSCAAIGHALGADDLVAQAERLATRCLERSTRRPEGLAWHDAGHRGADYDDLCGLAHGTTGAALAYATLALATGDERWAMIARQSRRYDRSGFDPRNGGWLDLRTRDGEQTGQHFWCHGAVGVGTERVWSAQRQDDPSIYADAAAAISGVEARIVQLLEGPHGHGAGFETNLCVCHGMSGAADLFLEAASWSGDARFGRLAHRVLDFGRREREARGVWSCGLPDGGRAPGFMLGLAGIGHTYLRSFNQVSSPPAILPPLVDQLGRAEIRGHASEPGVELRLTRESGHDGSG